MAETKVAFLCPGQGAQTPGMGADLCREFPVAQAVFDEADEALGFSIRELCAEGPEETLTLTENAQPALLTMSAAIARILATEAGIAPSIAAGHSLGEWSALVACEVLPLRDAVRAVRQRGLFMREALAPGLGGMTALLGADLPTVEAICAAASRGPESLVTAANLNGGGQIVIAGHVEALSRAETEAASRKVRASRLKVSQPFHSPLMEPARERLEEVLAQLTFAKGVAPVVSNVSVEAVEQPEHWPGLLAAQVTAPVRWEECAGAVAAAAPAAVEVGPGRVLAGLMRRIERGCPVANTGDVKGVRARIEEQGQ